MSRLPALHVVASAAPPVLELPHGLRLIRAWGWDPYVTLTPTAARWLAASLDEVAEAAGRPPRHTDRLPGEDRPFPAPQAVLAAPLTFNTLNKWVTGINDNPAVGILNEALGPSLHTVAAPAFNPDLAAHPRYPGAIATLRRSGVHMVLTAEGAPRPATGRAWWEEVLRELPSL
ncbi:flavoprotein [Yinghuangia sp. YIM S10712]|uniref:flavoprotein n=1 Tax=Yinghuangia sp. YIM S10712 TaxID=3436930 RepID=UPI003F52F0EC